MKTSAARLADSMSLHTELAMQKDRMARLEYEIKQGAGVASPEAFRHFHCARLLVAS